MEFFRMRDRIREFIKKPSAVRLALSVDQTLQKSNQNLD